MRARRFAPLRIVPVPSRCGLALTLLAALAASVALCAVGGAHAGLLLLPALVLVLWQGRQFGAFGARPPVLDIDAAGRLLLNGQPVRLAASTVVLPWLIVLRGRAAGRRFCVILCADSAPPAALRTLRVLLHWHVSPRLATRPPDLESFKTSS